MLVLEGNLKCPKNKKQQNYHTTEEVFEGSLRVGLLAGGSGRVNEHYWPVESGRVSN